MIPLHRLSSAWGPKKFVSCPFPIVAAAMEKELYLLTIKIRLHLQRGGERPVSTEGVGLA